MLEKYLDQINNCTRCGFCRLWGWADVETVCPVYKFTPGWETQYARGKVKLSKMIAQGEGDISEELVKHTYMCTLCGHCEVACPLDLPLHEIFQALRTELAEQGHTLSDHRLLAENIEKYRHPFGERRRHQYGEGSPAEKVNILYYPGCNANYNAPKIIRANKALFEKAALDFHILAEDACCGYPLYENGQLDEMKKTAARTMAVLHRYNPRMIVTSCPGCYHALKNLYPEMLSLEQPFEIVDISIFLAEITAKLELTNTEKVITWHDPCVLGRQLGVYEEPRQVLKSVPGLQLVELKLHHEKSKCCGASLAEVHDLNELSMQVAVDRVKEIGQVGAEELVTSCPACYINLKRAASFSQSKAKVKFISELINEVAVTKNDSL